MNEIRAPADDSVKEQLLYEYFEKNGKPKQLSAKYGISYNTVKSWIARAKKNKNNNKDKISLKSEGASSKPKKRKRGAPPGNKNAAGSKGGAAPFRNKNAEKHGAYSKIYWDSITEDEQELLENYTDSEEQELIDQINLYSIRERRLMTRIKDYTEMESKNHGLAIKSINVQKTKEDIVSKSGTKKGESEKEVKTTTTAAIIDSILALETELTKVQRSKTKAIDTLSKVRLQKANEDRTADLHALNKEYLDAQIEHMDAQTNKLLGTNVELEDTSDIIAEIYGGEDDENES